MPSTLAYCVDLHGSQDPSATPFSLSMVALWFKLVMGKLLVAILVQVSGNFSRQAIGCISSLFPNSHQSVCRVEKSGELLNVLWTPLTADLQLGMVSQSVYRACIGSAVRLGSLSVSYS